MNSISQEDVREIVQAENKHIEKSLSRLADSVEKMVTAVNELAIQSKVTEEKFTRVHERIDEAQTAANQANQSIMTMTTQVLPDLEANVAVNSFSSQKMWKIAFAITLPLILGAWGVLERFNSLQSDQIKIIADAISKLGKTVGTP